MAVLLTSLSYILRARRWQHMFPVAKISAENAVKVIFLGFFMNNVLPAKTGELVRAHLGSKVTGEKRTLVLATIVAERIADGLTLSLLFVLFSMGLGDRTLSNEMFYVSCAFAAIALAVVSIVAARAPIQRLVALLQRRFDGKLGSYTADRVNVFIDGLGALCDRSKLPRIAAGSLLVWTVELGVYFAISEAFSANLLPSYCVLFLVAVNFSSLIPAAPGGIGVIEVVATAALVSVGVEKELALTMVLTQHAIQYIVIGVPGTFLTITWKKTLNKIELMDEQRQKPDFIRC